MYTWNLFSQELILAIFANHEIKDRRKCSRKNYTSTRHARVCFNGLPEKLERPNLASCWLKEWANCCFWAFDLGEPCGWQKSKCVTVKMGPIAWILLEIRARCTRVHIMHAAGQRDRLTAGCEHLIRENRSGGRNQSVLRQNWEKKPGFCLKLAQGVNVYTSCLGRSWRHCRQARATKRGMRLAKPMG